MKTAKMGIVLKREDREKSERRWERKKRSEMLSEEKNVQRVKAICAETYSAICSSCFASHKTHFHHRTQSQQQQVVLGNERTSEKNTSKNTRETSEKNLQELQTKVKQGKIQRMKKAKAKGKHVAGSRRGPRSNLWLSGSVSLWEPVCLSLETGRHQRGRCFL